MTAPVWVIAGVATIVVALVVWVLRLQRWSRACRDVFKAHTRARDADNEGEPLVEPDDIVSRRAATESGDAVPTCGPVPASASLDPQTGTAWKRFGNVRSPPATCVCLQRRRLIVPKMRMANAWSRLSTRQAPDRDAVCGRQCWWTEAQRMQRGRQQGSRNDPTLRGPPLHGSARLRCLQPELHPGLASSEPLMDRRRHDPLAGIRRAIRGVHRLGAAHVALADRGQRCLRRTACAPLHVLPLFRSASPARAR